MELNAKSRKLLTKLHPDLARVVIRAATLSKVDFIVTCVARSVAEQREMVRKGASKTMKSRHIPGANGYSHAVDVAPVIDGKVRWDWPPFYKIADAMKAAAKAEKIPIEWGGDWVSFKDGPHFQLPWASYPGTK
jgi:peptidoglycan L-alanyl-D-glutamate endopeptidase CwlK